MNKEIVVSTKKSKQFGNRVLGSETNVFSHNAWDDVEWDEVQTQRAAEAVKENSSEKMSIHTVDKYLTDADKSWNNFYRIHKNKFFKDRHWLFTEFPELYPMGGNKEPRIIFELGCGVGNTILPLIQNTSNEINLKIYGCDFSDRAIQILQENPDFIKEHCNVFVMDASLQNWTVPFSENSLDIIIMIFFLSAITPSKMKDVAANCFKYLKKGGVLLFRDYGLYDMTQLRFKKGQCIHDNFYARGDGTLVNFFTQKEIADLFCGVGFIENHNILDRRLQVNRGRMLKMYRVWIWAKFTKPLDD